MDNANNDLSDLTNAVTELTTCGKDKSKIEEALAEIGKLLVCEYELKTDDGFVLIPTWAEAYYGAEGFMDPNVDAVYKAEKGAYELIKNHRQINRFGKLYFGKNAGEYSEEYRYHRVDIVLSEGDGYALSYLLKEGLWGYGLRKKERLSQNEVALKLQKYCDAEDKVTLVKRRSLKPKKQTVVTKRVSGTVRYNITKLTSGKYKDCEDLKKKIEFMNEYNLGVFLVGKKARKKRKRRKTKQAEPAQ